MFQLGWLDLFILILASFRLTRLLVFDEITSFIRKPFLTVTYENSADGQMLEYTEVRGEGLQAWIGQLLSCHWCAGIWSTIMIVLIYYLTPLYPLLLILAVAGAAALVQVHLERWM